AVDNPSFEVSTVEVDREGPTYSVDTLLELRAQCGHGTALFFIIGQDSLNDLPRWQRPQELVSLCTLVVAPRPGIRPVQEDIARSPVPGVAAGAHILRSPLVGISGTELRRRIRAGVSLRYWVTPAVEEYIRANRLYRNDPPTAGGRR
ncbi:MAG: nicotinate-nicotinamide nucleotide adenylyltransferase, partial [SAR202 cluster bacterium]|nr:nicotinate-nicotinamide nucleotide adenylyltransferase [SAR202 cluster bacterium]